MVHRRNTKKVHAGLSVVLISLLTSCSNRIDNNLNMINQESTADIQNEEPIVEEKEISINFFGDLLIHNTVYNAAATGESYDFTNHFEDIKDKVTDADFTVGNLEVPTAGKELGYSNYPAFNCPEQILDALKNTLDVELLTTATNHSLDKGYKGLVNTLNFIDAANIDHIGTYKDSAEANDIYIKEINGIKVAFLNYTYGTNGIPLPKEYPYSVSLINKEKIVADSEKATELGADIIIAKLHWGTEYNVNENQEQKDLAKYLFENTNINLIVGDHPHVVQNIEKMQVEKDGESKEGVVIYSLGNFISAQTDTYRDTGIIAKVNFKINTDYPEKAKVTSIEYTPVYVDRNRESNDKKYRVVDINKAIADFESGTDKLISKEEYIKLIQYREYYRDKLIQDNFVIEDLS